MQRRVPAPDEEAAKRRLMESQLEAEFRLREAVQAAYLDVAKATIDRMLRRAEHLGTSAAAIGTAYSAILGINFAAGGPKLPPIALLPAALFAGSIFFVAINVGWITKSESVGRPLTWGTSSVVQHKRLAEYISWVNSTATRRDWALRTAIVSLALGVFSSPVPFLDVSARIVAIPCVILLVAWTAVEVIWGFVRRARRRKRRTKG